MSLTSVLTVVCVASAATWLGATCTWRGRLARKAAAVFVGSLLLLAAALSPLLALIGIVGLIGVLFLFEVITALQLPKRRSLDA